MVRRIEGTKHVATFDQKVVKMEPITRGDTEIVRVHLEDGTFQDVDEDGKLPVSGDA